MKSIFLKKKTFHALKRHPHQNGKPENMPVVPGLLVTFTSQMHDFAKLHDSSFEITLPLEKEILENESGRRMQLR